MTAARTMRVTISGVYSEYEVPANDDRWNGFAVPGFTLDQVRQLAAETDALGATVEGDEIEKITIGDDGIVSVHRGDRNWRKRVVWEPDGLYYVGGY